MGGELTMDMTQFRETFKEYSKATQRDLTVAINTKGFYIARGAVRETYRNDKKKVKAELEALINNPGGGKKTVMLASGHEVPFVALIVQARNAKQGKPSPFKGKTRAQGAAAMKQLSASFIGRTLRSIAFIASGGIPAIKAFEPFAEKKGQAPRLDRGPKVYGRAKGSGTPAKGGTWLPHAEIVNSASAKGDSKGALEQFYGTALAKAIASEVSSMQQYLNDKLSGTAKRFSSKP